MILKEFVGSRTNRRSTGELTLTRGSHNLMAFNLVKMTETDLYHRLEMYIADLLGEARRLHVVLTRGEYVFDWEVDGKQDRFVLFDFAAFQVRHFEFFESCQLRVLKNHAADILGIEDLRVFLDEIFPYTYWSEPAIQSQMALQRKHYLSQASQVVGDFVTRTKQIQMRLLNKNVANCHYRRKAIEYAKYDGWWRETIRELETLRDCWWQLHSKKLVSHYSAPAS